MSRATRSADEPTPVGTVVWSGEQRGVVTAVATLVAPSWREPRYLPIREIVFVDWSGHGTNCLPDR